MLEPDCGTQRASWFLSTQPCSQLKLLSNTEWKFCGGAGIGEQQSKRRSISSASPSGQRCCGERGEKRFQSAQEVEAAHSWDYPLD